MTFDEAIGELRTQFYFRTGSFMEGLRIGREWDAAAYSQLVSAMQTVCEHMATPEPASEAEAVPRWLAKGFWYFSWYVRKWTTNPDFSMPVSDSDYHERALKRLEHLAYFFFSGASPFKEGHVWEPL